MRLLPLLFFLLAAWASAQDQFTRVAYQANFAQFPSALLYAEHQIEWVALGGGIGMTRAPEDPVSFRWMGMVQLRFRAFEKKKWSFWVAPFWLNLGPKGYNTPISVMLEKRFENFHLVLNTDIYKGPGFYPGVQVRWNFFQR